MKEKQLRFQDLEIWRIAADLSLVLFEYSDVLDRKKILPVDLRPLITANLAPSPGTRPCCLALSSSSVDAIPLWPCPPSSFVNAIPLLCCLDGALSLLDTFMVLPRPHQRRRRCAGTAIGLREKNQLGLLLAARNQPREKKPVFRVLRPANPRRPRSAETGIYPCADAITARKTFASSAHRPPCALS